MSVLQACIQIYPAIPEAHANLGYAFLQLGDLNSSIASSREALVHNPSYPEALFNLANALAQQGDTNGAVEQYQAAILSRPVYLEAHLNLGNLFKRLGCYDRAIQCYQQALEHAPDDGRFYHNLGQAYLDLGDASMALDAYNCAVALSPADPIYRFHRALLLLLVGRYNEGWQDYEWRRSKPDWLDLGSACGLLSCPDDWLSSPIEGSVILLSEQGLGDTLQFMRYLPLLRAMGVNARLCAPEKLHGLIVDSGIVAQPLAPDQLSACAPAFYLPLLSLPRDLEVCPSDPRVVKPYIHVSVERVHCWRSRLGLSSAPLVALHWQGDPATEAHYMPGRSFPLELFSPLASHPEVTFVSLQKGFGSEQLPSCSFRHRFVACQDLVSEAWDFQDAAALISLCELVITTDSALAHLAGGLGAPTWLLLKHNPDWRWGLDSEHTFWYPSLRLFRQPHPGDWPGVIERVAAALAERFPRRSDGDGPA